MLNDEDPQALYRTWAADGTLLYIGKSNAPLRRVEEHRRSKDWMPYQAIRIDLEWYPGLAAVLDAEARAIRSEHPLHNIQHNTGRIKIEAGFSAEVSGSSLAGVFGLAAGAVGLLMLGKWAADALSVWRVQRMASRQGAPFDALVVRNPFTEDPPTVLQNVLYSCLVAGVTASQRSLDSDPDAMAMFTARLHASSQPRDAQNSPASQDRV
jgi:hypothetical protein